MKKSSNMKTVLKRAMYGCVALGCVLTIASCSSGNGGGDTGEVGGSVSLYLEKGDEGKVKSGDKTLKLLSKKEIKTMLDATDPAKTWPAGSYPISGNRLSNAAIQSGLNRVNVIRRLMGVHPVTENTEYTRKAQLGAMLLGKNNKGLSHSVGTKPSGVSDADFKDGNEALGHGNVAGYNLPLSADNWLQDPGQMGNPMHRVWMTAPVAGRFGFGYVASSSRAAAAMTGYSVLRACDSSASPKASTLYPGGWDFVAWPAPGYCPIGLWSKSHVENDLLPTNTIYTSHWSISVPGTKDIGNYLEIELTRKTDNKTWTISMTEDTSGQGAPVKTFKGGEGITGAFNIGGPGSTGQNTYSFYITDSNHTYEDGDVYTIDISYGGTGTAAKKITYTVEFFDPAKVN